MYIKSFQVLTIHLNKLNILGKADSVFKFQVIGLINFFKLSVFFQDATKTVSPGNVSGRKSKAVVGQLLCIVGSDLTQSREYIITEFSFLGELLLKRQFKPI